MKEFNLRSETAHAEVRIWGQVRTFDVSPTNISFMRRIFGFRDDIGAIVSKLEQGAKDPDSILGSYDSVCQKEREIVDFLFPGEWDALFDEAGNDVLVMARLITFVTSEIGAAFAGAKIQSATASVPGGGERI